jgi:hypothetical protein
MMRLVIQSYNRKSKIELSLKSESSKLGYRIQIEGFLWDRDSHGLYDYESKNIVRQSMKCTGCSKSLRTQNSNRIDIKQYSFVDHLLLLAMISRKETEMRANIPNVDSSEEYLNLLSLVYKQGQYWFYHSKSLKDDSFKNHADRVWRIVKYEAYQNKKGNTLRVFEGNTIKFGRVRFRIKKLVIDKGDIDNS